MSLLATSPAGAGEPFSYYGGTYENINDFSSFNSSFLKGRNSLWIFFQANCESCQRQFRSLSCLPITAPVVAVGFWGTKETLQKELRRYGHRGAAVMGDKNLAERNDFKQTPTLLIINENGLIKNKYTAVVDCSVLKKELSQ